MNHISATFTATSRRKRIATYGKASRTRSLPTWNDDASSPERPRKQPGTIPSISQRAAVPSASRDVQASRQKKAQAPADRDIFEVPSEDELGSAAPAVAPGEKPAPKRSASVDVFNIPSSDDEGALPQRRRGKTALNQVNPAPSRRPDRSVHSPYKNGLQDGASPDESILPARQRTKAPPVLRRGDNSVVDSQKATRPERPKTTSRGTTPSAHFSVTVKKTKLLPSMSTKTSKKPTSGVDIFDVPSSEDDDPLLAPRIHKPIPVPRTKLTPPIRGFDTQLSPVSNGSDDSNATRKRKRMEPNKGLSGDRENATNIPADGKTSNARTRRQAQRKLEVTTSAKKSHMPEMDESNDPPVNKPRRTRLRTAPRVSRPAIVKNQSAPANLLGMLPVRSVRKFSPTVEVPQIEETEELTAYDIPNSTPEATRNTVSGAVTPQQKALFSNLLGESSDTTSLDMPSIRKLQLTDRKHGLVRSSSDIPQSVYARKTRLIEALVQKGLSEEEEEVSESDEETEEGIVDIPEESKAIPKDLNGVDARSTEDPIPDEMDIDAGELTYSQGSVSAPRPTLASRVTYDKQRSYREDSNMEEGLLLGMDLDDPVDVEGSASNKRQDASSDDEDDPASQVRGIHELRRQAENEKFQMEAQTAIDDIADKAGLGKSLRRTAMLELCTRMADRSFLGSLLESPLVGQFLGRIGYTGEIIFDFSACVSVALILEAQPDCTVLYEIYASGIMTSLQNLLEYDTDIKRIARERKTNMSKVGRDTVETFRNLVQMSSLWSLEKPAKVTPQIVALEALEGLVLALRKAGNTEGLINEEIASRLLDILAQPCERLVVGKETAQDRMVLTFAFSIMEAASISTEKHATWSGNFLQRLAGTMSILFGAKGTSPIKLATRLCVLLTNNRPKTCEIFACQTFVRPLMAFINGLFKRAAVVAAEEQSTVREELILSLGAMINIAEFSDTARLNILTDGDELLDAMVATFLEGSERASQANSVEESQANIPFGYLAVLLGNLCLNDLVRIKTRARLPGKTMDLLVEQVKEFVGFHERVDRLTEQFAGEEGQQASQNYTRRLVQVVRKLEQTCD